MLAGAIKSPPDTSDLIFEQNMTTLCAFSAAALPPELDLRPYARPVRDQGDRPTCAAFAAASLLEAGEGLNKYLSPEFIYEHRINKPSAGMYGRNVFQILTRLGTTTETLYPYGAGPSPGPNPLSNLSSAEREKLYRAAKKHRIGAFVRVDSVEGLKRALWELGPCYAQLWMYQNTAHFWRPMKEGHKPIGGHAVAVFGYNKHGFILRNSWGEDWGDGGYTVLPYDDWEHVMEVWAPITFPLSHPSPSEAETVSPPSPSEDDETGEDSDSSVSNTDADANGTKKRRSRCAIV